jgi:HAD superfamily hydrolase (TIGR01450 family)
VKTVAIVGLGAMGSRIAARLLGAGYEVVVWNRSPEKARPLVALGARPANSPADAARRAEALITMVTDPSALKAVTEGPDGLAAGASAALTVLEMSTVAPGAVARLASILPAKTNLLDAPVLGSLAEAEAGTLQIFVGGLPQVVDTARPLLSTLGVPLYMGGLGAGAAAKLVANATLFGTIATLGEALALAQLTGLRRECAYQVLATTPLAAQAERRRGAIESGEYRRRFSLALARKDAGLIAEVAAKAGVDLRLARAAEAWLAQAQGAGLGDQDYSAVLETILHPDTSRPQRAGDGAPLSLLSSSPARSSPGQLECDGLIVDLDGVVWLGGIPIEGAVDAIAAVRASRIHVMFLTNEPGRSRHAIAQQLTTIGIPVTAAEVMTSAVAMARFLGSLDDLTARRALVVGPAALSDEIREAGFELAHVDEARTADVVVVGGHPGFDYTELSAATSAIRNGARLFGTGRDVIFPTPEGVKPGTGAILAAIEAAGGVSAVVVGKPEPVIFQMAREALPGCQRVAVIGDHLTSDIAGAHRAGLAAILVLTGATTRNDIERALIPPDLVLESLAGLPAALVGRG